MYITLIYIPSEFWCGGNKPRERWSPLLYKKQQNNNPLVITAIYHVCLFTAYTLSFRLGHKDLTINLLKTATEALRFRSNIVHNYS